MNAQRLLESVHGHLGILCTVALLHPAMLMRRGLPLSRGARWSLGLTMLVTVAAFAMGISIYEPYRATVKRTLVFQHPRVAVLFETKEHLAFVVLALALGAGIAAWFAPSDAVETRRACARVFAAATLLCLVVGALGTLAASVQGF